MTDSDIRAALSQHWAASDANDFELEHQIYREDAVLEYPQSGERIRGRRNIQTTRTLQPSRKRFKVRRVIGAGDLWVTEYVNPVRRAAVLYGQHHGVRGQPGCAGNAIFRRSI